MNENAWAEGLPDDKVVPGNPNFDADPEDEDEKVEVKKTEATDGASPAATTAMAPKEAAAAVKPAARTGPLCLISKKGPSGLRGARRWGIALRKLKADADDIEQTCEKRADAMLAVINKSPEDYIRSKHSKLLDEPILHRLVKGGLVLYP